MPRIPVYEAPPVTLHPDQQGSAAWARAGAMAQHYGAQTRAILDREGQELSSGIASFGPIFKQAEEHTDMMAEAQFYSDQTQSQLAFTQTLEQGGSAKKDIDGSTISVPSAGQYATVADDVMQQHVQMTQNSIERARAAGASPRLIDKLTVHAAQQTSRLTLQAHAVEHQRQVQELTHNYDTSVAALTGPLFDHPTGLPDALAQHQQMLTMFGGSKSEQRIAMGPRELADRQNMITQAAMGWANIGNPDEGKRMIHDPQYAEVLGKHLPSVEKAVDAVINEKRTQLNHAQTEAAHAATGSYVADAMAPQPQKKLIDIIQDQAYKDRPDLAKTAAETVKTIKQLKAGELEVPAETTFNSMRGPNGLLPRIYKQPGDPQRITDRTPIDQALVNHDIDEKAHDYAIKQLNDVDKNPGVKAAITDALEHGVMSQIDTASTPGVAFSKTNAGQAAVGKWEMALRDRMAAGEKLTDLLDPRKPGSMTDPKILLNYRVTENAAQEYEKNQTKLNEEADKLRAAARGEQPGAAAPAQQTPGFFERMFWLGAPRPETAKPGAIEAKPTTAPAATPSAAPAQPTAAPPPPPPPAAPVKTIDDVKSLAPGTKFIIPEGPHKGQIGTVPEKMSYAPETGGETSAQTAIQSALQDTARGAVARLQKASLGPPEEAGTPAAHTPSDAAMGGGNVAPMGKAASGGAQSTYAAATIMIESGGRTGQRTGSYEGLGQFSKSEQRRLGITDPDNRAQVTRALQQEAEGFRPALTKALGHEPEPSDYYLAHQQGIGGAIAHLTHPEQPAYLSMAQTGEGRSKGIGWAKRAIWGNMSKGMRAEFPDGVESVTSADFVEMWAARYNREVTRVAGR